MQRQETDIVRIRQGRHRVGPYCWRHASWQSTFAPSMLSTVGGSAPLPGQSPGHVRPRPRLVEAAPVARCLGCVQHELGVPTQGGAVRLEIDPAEFATRRRRRRLRAGVTNAVVVRARGNAVQVGDVVVGRVVRVVVVRREVPGLRVPDSSPPDVDTVDVLGLLVAEQRGTSACRDHIHDVVVGVRTGPQVDRTASTC